MTSSRYINNKSFLEYFISTYKILINDIRISVFHVRLKNSIKTIVYKFIKGSLYIILYGILENCSDRFLLIQNL